jgi:hypothetical protein
MRVLRFVDIVTPHVADVAQSGGNLDENRAERFEPMSHHVGIMHAQYAVMLAARLLRWDEMKEVSLIGASLG